MINQCILCGDRFDAEQSLEDKCPVCAMYQKRNRCRSCGMRLDPRTADTDLLMCSECVRDEAESAQARAAMVREDARSLFLPRNSGKILTSEQSETPNQIGENLNKL